MAQTNQQEMNLVIAGHVDHGKSTIVGRMLADADALPEGKLEAVREACRRNAKPFEYAFLLDALKEEQNQGITIDAARIFFQTKLRKYLIIDAPGHIEFLKNMITGASRAEAALLVIDAQEGVQENSRRHAYMLDLLGIQQIAVVVNKMDLVSYNPAVYERIRSEFKGFLSKIDIQPLVFIPVSGVQGDHIVERSPRMPWYEGPTLLEQLDLFQNESLPEEKPLRLPVQDVYKFTNNGDNRRIIAGRVESGSISVGDRLFFYPSGKTSLVRTIESFNHNDAVQRIPAGWSAGITLTEQIFVRRGEIAACNPDQKPATSSRMQVRLFWVGKRPLQKRRKYIFKLATSKVEMEVEAIERVLNASDLSQKSAQQVGRNDIAECILQLEQIIAFDRASEFPGTGRFVIVDDYEICGGGLILDALPDKNQWVYESAVKRNERWELIEISDEMRAERYSQKACMILISGSPQNSYRKELAKELTEKLFHEGKFVYFIGMANLLYGMDADIRNVGAEMRPEHMRRLAEVGNLMMHAGLILVASAREISEADVRTLKTALADRNDRLITVWAGEPITTDLQPDLYFSEPLLGHAWAEIKSYLIEQGYIFGFNHH